MDHLSRITRFCIYCALLTSTLGVAQEQEGVPIGRWNLYPSLDIEYSYTDNLFFEPSGGAVESDFLLIARPQIGIEIPFYESYLHIGYSPEYRRYNDFDLDRDINHLFTLDTLLKSPTRFSFAATERFVRGQLQTTEFDPDREIVFGSRPFESHLATASFQYDMTPLDALSLTSRLRDVEFEQTDTIEPGETFFEYETTALDFEYARRINPLTSLHLRAGYGDTRQERASVFDRDFNEFSSHLGMRGQIVPSLTGTLFIGYDRKSFRSPSFVTHPKFEGLVGDAELAFQPTSGTRAALSLRRDANQSSFAINNYYVTEFGQLSLVHQLTSTITTGLASSYRQNQYPEETLIRDVGQIGPSLARRSDNLFTVSSTIEWGPSARARTGLQYSYEERDSNMELFDYRRNEFLLQMTIGWQ